MVGVFQLYSTMWSRYERRWLSRMKSISKPVALLDHRLKQKFTIYHLSITPHFLVIGINLPLPNDFPLTFNTNPICQRLCSLVRMAALL